MVIDRDQVCIFIPTLNEEPTIGTLVKEFKDLGYSHIFVMDGNSSDNTLETARAAGAEVTIQEGKGKGAAIIESVPLFTRPYILMLDGDGTYLPEDADKMVAPLFEGYDHVIGNRLVAPDKDALSRLNLFGNRIINEMFRIVDGRHLGDILSGYRAFTLDGMKEMRLTEPGFVIETEMAVESLRNEQKIQIVPVSYVSRPGTPTKLRPFHDGGKIIAALYRLARRNNPLFYFGLIGGVISCIGLFTGCYVVWEWFRGIEHLPLTILTALLVMGGMQIFMFGILSDIIYANQQELRSEIQHLQNELSQKERR